MKATASLLLLVALLLPFRAALAASGMICHVGSPSPVATIHAHDVGSHDPSDVAVGHRHLGDHADRVVHDHARLVVTADQTRDSAAPAGAPTCDLCSSACTSPPLPSHPAQWLALVRATSERFPAIRPPRPAPTLGGLERPPRSV